MSIDARRIKGTPIDAFDLFYGNGEWAGWISRHEDGVFRLRSVGALLSDDERRQLATRASYHVNVRETVIP